MDRELQRIVEAEQARPFLHWSYHFVPFNDLNNFALSKSPLAQLPSGPVLGYFQLRPDGSIETPYRSRDGATTHSPVDVEALEKKLAVAVAPLERPEKVASSKSSLSAPPVVQKMQQQQFDNFQSNASPAEIFEQQAAAPPPRAVPAVGPDGEISVTVEPFELLDGGETLVLHRTVSVAGQTWVQGLAWHRERFLDELGAVEEGGAVDWSGGDHTFAPPFEGLSASVRLPPAQRESAAWLWGLAALSLGVVAAGGWMAERWMAGTIALAQQRADFVAAVSHELRTPLTSIRMYADMLEQGMVPPPRHAEYHGTIRLEAERLGRLVEDVLTFSRLEHAGDPAGPPGAVGEALAEVERMLGPAAEAASVALSTDCEPIAATRIEDRDALVQILVNLIDNAVKFSAEAAQRAVSVEGRGSADRVTLVVRDRGPGVAPEFLPRMFEPFVRGEREATRKTRGTGIGLALVQGLVERQGGRVWALNRSGGGLEVHVELPVGQTAG